MECNKKGERSISTHGDFLVFFNKIKSIYTETPRMDILVQDFGEVKVNIAGKYNSVILGTGYNRIFGFMQFSDAILKHAKDERILELINFFSGMLEFLLPSNPFIEENEVGFYEPSADFFRTCKDFYKIDLFNFQKSNLIKCLPTNDDIAKTHYIIYDDNVYYLFNTTFQVDLLCKYLYLIKNEDVESICFCGIYQALRNCYDFDDKKEQIISRGSILNYKKPLHNDCSLILDAEKKRMLLMIPEYSLGKNGDFPRCSIKNEIEEINKLKDKEMLSFAWPISKTDGRAITIPKEARLICVVYDCNINIDKGIIPSFDGSGKDFLLGLDLMHIIRMSKSTSEILDFFEYDFASHNELTYSNMYSGSTGDFSLWQNMQGEINQGAIKYITFNFDVYYSELAIFDYYRKTLKNYPFFIENDMMFNDANRWKLEEENEYQFTVFVNKSIWKHIGHYRKLSEENKILFITQNFNFHEKLTSITIEQDRSIVGQLQRLFNIYWNDLIECNFFSAENTSILYLPFDYAQNMNDNSFTKQSSQYVFGDLCNSYSKDEKITLMRFTVDINAFLSASLGVKNREQECKFFVEFLYAFRGNKNFNFNKMKEIVLKDVNEPREMAVFKYVPHYHFDPENTCLWANDNDFIKVRKDIAQICKKTEIKSGTYTGKEATGIIRKMQIALIENFEEQIKYFNKFDMHCKLLSKLSAEEHTKRINCERLKIKNEENLNFDLANMYYERTVKQRGVNINNIKSLQYLIESNLFLERNTSKFIDKHTLNYLVAYADWLVVLQNNSDFAFWGIDQCEINVLDDFRVNTDVINKDYIDEIAKRKAAQESYIILPPEHFDNFNDAFYKDAGFTMSAFYAAMDFFAFRCDGLAKKICEDVYSIDRSTLNNLIAGLKLDIDLSKFIVWNTVNCSKLKTTYRNSQEEAHPIIPIWEVENRPNRIEIKPFLLDGKNIIFSPVVVYSTFARWMFARNNFYLPYEFGLTNIVKQTRIAEKYNQKKIVDDVLKLFSDKGFCAYKDVKLKSRFKLDDYPKDNELGDYDCLAIDKKNKVIWNVECKFFEKVGSIGEFAKHQQTFINNGNDKKFEKRINYLSDNYRKILKSFEIENPEDDYAIKSFMVTNKVFIPLFKKFKFECITFHELKTELETGTV